MNLSSNTWVTENNPVKQALVSVGGIVAGLLLTIGARQAGGSSIGTISALLLGLLLLTAGFIVLIFGGKEIITVDAKAQRITLERKNCLGTSLKHIRFNEIADAYVVDLSDKENWSVCYEVMLKLKSGKKVPLFRGAFDGRDNKSVTEARCQRLMQYVRANHLNS